MQKYDSAPTCLCKQEVENKAQRCVNNDLRAGKLSKGRGFWVSIWNVDSLTARVGELVDIGGQTG